MNKRIISLILSIVMILLIIPPATFSAQAADYVTELRNKGFPESYIPSLLALHDKYPKWNFEPLIVGENFSTAVSKERQIGGHAQQRIQKYSGNDGKGYYCTCSACTDSKGNPIVRENPNWVAASQSAVEYYLDPRNFLDEKYIFQFESTEYKSSHTQAGVETILSGTFMANANITYKDASGKTQTYKNSSGSTVKYSKAIMDAAKDNKISAYYIAAKIVQEVGGKTMSAGGVSGTNPTYPGIYNFYNIGANTGALDGLKWAYGDYRWIHISVTYNGKAYNGYIREDLVNKKADGWYTNTACNLRKGPSTSTDALVLLPNNTKVTYIETVVSSDKDTYNRPWTNPYLSIYNGAKWIANNFGGTQFTGYLQKFNVNPASGSSMHGHEYMTNVQGAASEGANAYNAYKNANLLNSEITFTIPVFNNMPNELPGGITAKASNSGIDISWNKFPGAQKYRVFYKANGESTWHKVGDTTSTSYSWTGAVIGTKYAFTVRCVSADGSTYTSSYDPTGASLNYVATPKLSAVSCEATGIKISWGAVSGAEKYRIYYKANGESTWHKAGDTTSTSYTWTAAVSKTNYAFTVRCMTSDGSCYASGYNTTGLSVTYFAAPKLTSVAADNGGITVKWGAVAGAQKYRVFYKANGESTWHKAGDTTATSYTWKSAVNKTNYAFTVRCINSAGTAYTSGYDNTGLSLAAVAAPKLSAVSNAATGVKISWGAVSGAVKYRVFYKANGESTWHKVGDTTSTSYTWTAAQSGTKYAFTVRCINSAGTAYVSGYDDTGKSLTYIAAPKISSVANAETGVSIAWGKVSGAAKYRVFYKANGESTWHKAGDTTGTSYTWTGAKSGTNYAFTVRCISADGKSYTSSYDNTGKNIKYVAAPKISAISSTTAGVTVTWGAVTGAEKYRVFYKKSTGGWTKIADTTSTSYTWANADKNTNYTFTVRCISSDGKTYVSGYDSAGRSVNGVSTPKLSSVSNAATGVKISWGAVSGAAKYRVFYKANGESTWHKAGDTASTSYTWTGAKSGTKYAFTVRCISSDGSSYTSSYDNTGLSISYVAAPKLSSVSKTSSGVQISWGKVTGAAKYRVFYKASGESTWHKAGDTTGTSYTWTGGKSGTKYAFTVRCISSDGKSYTSGYDSTGKSITR